MSFSDISSKELFEEYRNNNAVPDDSRAILSKLWQNILSNDRFFCLRSGWRVLGMTLMGVSQKEYHAEPPTGFLCQLKRYVELECD
jgi:hypothetical protein